MELNQTALLEGDIYSDLRVDLAMTGAINVRFFLWTFLQKGSERCVLIDFDLQNYPSPVLWRWFSMYPRVSKLVSTTRIDRFPNYCLGTSNGAWPVAKGRAITSFPYFPYGRVEKRQWEDGQEGEERRLWQSERLVECFLTKGIFEAAKTSHQRKQILLGVEQKLSVAQSCVAMA